MQNQLEKKQASRHTENFKQKFISETTARSSLFARSINYIPISDKTGGNPWITPKFQTILYQNPLDKAEINLEDIKANI